MQTMSMTVLLVNTPAQTKSLLHSLEWAAGSIGLHVNADKTEYMCFNQRGDISTQKGGSLKLVDKFTYLQSSVLSTENDSNIWWAKAWTAIDRLSVIWRSDLIDKISSMWNTNHLVQNLNLDNHVQDENCSQQTSTLRV